MTDRALTIAGAAIPKAPQEIRNRGGQRKCECFECGECAGYFSRATIRDGRLPHCHCGAGVLVPSVLADCAELAPDSLPRHPLAQLEQERWMRGAARRGPVAGPASPDRCHACKAIIPHPRHECSCGFDNGAQAYREGASYLPDRAVTVPPIALDRLMPSTRAERAAHEKNRKAADDLPF